MAKKSRVKNERNAGRKPDGNEAKQHKSIRLEQDIIDIIEKDFPSFSEGMELLAKNYVSVKNKFKK